MKKLTITFIVIDVLIAICFLLCYSPLFTNFQNMIISTAVNTKTHDYIAYTLWSEDHVREVIAAGAFIPVNEDVNLNDIVIDTTPKTSYDNEFEEAVLKRDEGNDNYKIIKTKCGSGTAYIAVIYDPSAVHLMACKAFKTSGNTGKETVLKMNKRLGATVGINAGGFLDTGDVAYDVPLGPVIKDGKAIWSPSDKSYRMVGISNDNKLMLINDTIEGAIEKGLRDGVQFGPFLIVNGKIDEANKKAGGYSVAARSAIAQRKDGIFLFMVVEGLHGVRGATMIQVAETLKQYGAYNAANLDGGTSTQLVADGKLLNNVVNYKNVKINGGRNVVTAFGAFFNEEEEE